MKLTTDFMRGPYVKSLFLLTLIANLLHVHAAYAAACCASSAVSGIGRLNSWERAGIGLLSNYAMSVGRWDQAGHSTAFSGGYSEAEWRTDLWGQLRVAESWQLYARLPWVVGLRSAEGLGDHRGFGWGDAMIGGRWEALGIGEKPGWPAIAVTAIVSAPTSRTAEEATDELGADATGRGGWTTGIGVQIEKTRAPWFARLDAGLSIPLPFDRALSGATVRYGPMFQGGLLAGRELLADRVVLALQFTGETETSMVSDGAVQPRTDASTYVTAVALSWRATPEWTWMVNASTDAAGHWLGAHNRPERWATTVAIRRGFLE